jgi:hypothetical protein
MHPRARLIRRRSWSNAQTNMWSVESIMFDKH